MSKKPLDRVAEAYKGDIGEDFSKKTRNRINWIVNHVTGKKILDVGCSQGIVPIILGREGKKVDAIDIAQESIDYALNDLKNEHFTVQENVVFKVSNFMTDDTLSDDYETVLLTEVLEHLSDPYSCLEKIHSHLINDGYLVVTVPFGINDYFDHKRTYYYTELMDHLSAYFTVEEMEYLGNWVGVVCKKKINVERERSKKDTYSRESIERLEKAFYTVERGLVTRIEDFQGKLREKNEYIKRIQIVHQNELKKEKESNRNLLQQMTDQSKEFNLQIGSIEEERKNNKILTDNNQLLQQQMLEKEDLIQDLNNQVTKINTELEKSLKNEEKALQHKMLFEATKSKELDEERKNIKILTDKNQLQEQQMLEKEDLIQDLNNQVNTIKAELLKSLSNEEKALQYNLKQKEQFSQNETSIINLERKINVLERKYYALKNSKLGRLTLKYWQFKRKYTNRA